MWLWEGESNSTTEERKCKILRHVPAIKHLGWGAGKGLCASGKDRTEGERTAASLSKQEERDAEVRRLILSSGVGEEVMVEDLEAEYVGTHRRCGEEDFYFLGELDLLQRVRFKEEVLVI